MRVGVNPAKLDFQLEKKYHHRIIIPVFIPNFEGYFKDIFEVYKICIRSASLTQHKRSAITIVDNGSCQEVKDWLLEEYESGVIETLISHTENIGKVDAILGAARSCREDLITVSDSDILFRNGWQEGVEEVFANFQKAGSVAPFPITRHMYYFSTSVAKAVLKKRLNFGFEDSEYPEEIADIYQCYQWDFDKSYDGVLPVVKSGAYKAVMGSGHQIMTIRRDVIFGLPEEPSFIKISNGSEVNWIDKPIDDNGYWRLSTLRPWVGHMGNTLTEENRKEFSELKENESVPTLISLNPIKSKLSSRLSKRVAVRLFRMKFDKRGPAPKLKTNIHQDGA